MAQSDVARLSAMPLRPATRDDAQDTGCAVTDRVVRSEEYGLADDEHVLTKPLR